MSKHLVNVYGIDCIYFIKYDHHKLQCRPIPDLKTWHT